MPNENSRGGLADGRVDVSTPAVVLGVHDHNGLAQVRSLGRLGVEVSITHPPGRLPAVTTRYAARRFAWDAHAAGVEATVRHLVDVVGPAVGRRAVLLPSEDESAILIAEHADVLSRWFIVPEPEPGLTRRLVDKMGLHELCVATGTPVPRTLAPASTADAEAFIAGARFPVVVKARAGWRVPAHTARITFIAQDAAEAHDALTHLSVDGDMNAILQEYLPGGADTVWTYHAYADRSSEPVFGLVGNKLREYPFDTGLTTFGVNQPNPDVLEAGAHFVRSVGYRGVVDLDFRFDRRDGQYKQLDFNPRPGANFRLFTDDAGVDVVRAAYLDLTGQPIPPGRQRVGRKWMVEQWDLAVARRYIRSGRISTRDYVRSLRQVEEGAWFARDDLRPFGAMLAEFAGIGLARLARRPPR